MKPAFILDSFTPKLRAALLVLLVAGQTVRAGEVVLSDSKVTIAFDKKTGALTRLVDKTDHWTIERRPALGATFRILAPMPGRRDNFIQSPDQKAAKVKKLSRHEVQIVWKDLVSEHDGVLPMTFTADVTLTNGVLTFAATLQNDSDLPVETIDYPYFGDINPPARDSSLDMAVMRNGRANDLRVDNIYPRFGNEKGYWGVFYPIKTRDAQDSMFCLMQAPDYGIYVGVAAAKSPYRLEYTFEQHPGVISSVTQLVPPEDEIAGTPVHLEFRTCHFVFIQPHANVTLVPVTLQTYDGDSKAGVDLFQQFRSSLAK